MDYICPDINHLVACFTCGAQSLPPYRLCESGHVGCQPCTAYLRVCLCTQPYVPNAHYVFDALVSALLLKCKYAASLSERGGDGETCDGRWYDVQQLRDHYRSGCTRNAYTCPLAGCGRVDRIDTVVEHYEAEHDTHPRPSVADDQQHEVVIRIPITEQDKEEVFKIFNGYFMFNMTGLRGTKPDISTKLTVRNINPTDPLQYTCSASAYVNEVTVILSLINTTSTEYEQVRWLIKPIEALDNKFSLSQHLRNAFLKGTDVYRLKFHSSLLKLYEASSPTLFSVEDDKTFLSSCYSTASIYFFTKNHDLALHVLEDGSNLITSLLEKSQKELSEMDKQELLVWSVVYQTLKVNLMVYKSNDRQEILKEENILTVKENKLIMDPSNKYPGVYLQLYRGYFLDKDFDNAKKNKLIEVIKSDFIVTKRHEYMDVFVYYYLTLADGQTNDVNKKLTDFLNLIKAVKHSVLIVEDRLLNYKANQLALNKVKECIGDQGWIADDKNLIMCTELSALRIKDIDLDYILTKYTHIKIYDYKVVIEKLKLYIQKNDIINADMVHNIVSSAIDMDVYNTDVYNSKIENVIKAIELLEKFTTAKHIIEKQIKDTIKTKAQNKEDDKYEIKQLKTLMGPVVKAYKWLVELYAVLCSDPNNENIITYQKQVKMALNKAVEISTEHFELGENLVPIDNHLEYVISKHKCKEVLPYKSWENPIRNDGWIIEIVGLLKSTLNSIIGEVDECYFRVNAEEIIKSPYIHPTDTLIILFRYWFHRGNHYAARKAIRKAMSNIVVTSEDRYRNREAHELYSMFLLLENAQIIKNNSRFEEFPDDTNDYASDFY